MSPRAYRPTVAKAKNRGLLLTVLGLLLGAISTVTLVELVPRLSATASPPTNPSDPLSSSQFTVSNDGYLKVTDVMSACFMWKVEMGNGPIPNVRMNDILARIVQPPENKLSPTEGFTVPCTGGRLVGSSPPYMPPMLRRADLAIVVYYRAWPFTFYRDHRLFRFVANIGKNGEITWEKQPSDDLEPDYDAFIKDHGGTFPPHVPQPPFPTPPPK